jgi:two-component system NtrC family sensor kinase
MNLDYLLKRPFWLLVGLVSALFAALLTISGLLLWDGAQRIGPLREEAEALAVTQRALVQYLQADMTGSLRAYEEEAVNGALGAMEQVSEQVQHTLDALEGAHEGYGRLVRTTLTAVVGLGLMLISLAFFVQRRFVRPLARLSGLFRRLARRDYSREEVDCLDPLVAPVFDNYNFLVDRLARLEAAHQSRRQELEAQVRAAASTLVAQRADLARAERLAAVGEVAASLAHEIRNPLAAIRAACRSLHGDLTEADHVERLGMVVEEVDRLIALVNRELSQARQQPETAGPVDVGDLLGELAGLLEYQVPDNVSLNVDAPDGLVCTLPPNGLRQVVLNLVRNAQQALDGHAGRIDLGAARSADGIRLTVRDDGPGFPADLLAQGLRPFATTRADGTGLGLAMVRRYAHDLGGKAQFVNRPEGGACVTLELPCRHA